MPLLCKWGARWSLKTNSNKRKTVLYYCTVLLQKMQYFGHEKNCTHKKCYKNSALYSTVKQCSFPVTHCSFFFHKGTDQLEHKYSCPFPHCTRQPWKAGLWVGSLWTTALMAPSGSGSFVPSIWTTWRSKVNSGLQCHEWAFLPLLRFSIFMFWRWRGANWNSPLKF